MQNPTKQITNIKSLRDDLLEAYDLLKKDPRRLNQVAELSNTAGKIIATAKLELEYAISRGEKPDISFIGDATTKVISDSKEPPKLGEGTKK